MSEDDHDLTLEGWIRLILISVQDDDRLLYMLCHGDDPSQIHGSSLVGPANTLKRLLKNHDQKKGV